MGLFRFLVIGGAIAYFINRSKECHKNTKVYRVIQQSSMQDGNVDELPPYHGQGLPSSLRQRFQEEARKSRINVEVQEVSGVEHPEAPMSRTDSNPRMYIEQVHPEPTAMEQNVNYNHPYPNTYQEPPQRGWMIMEQNPRYARTEPPMKREPSWLWSW